MTADRSVPPRSPAVIDRWRGRQVAALNPFLPNIRENWGKILRLLGRPDKAAAHFSAARQFRLRAAPAVRP